MAGDGARNYLVGLMSTLTWTLVSSALIIANKRVYASGFPYPMFVTGVGQLASALGGMLMGMLSGKRNRSLPPTGWMIPTLGPLWASTFLTMWLGNAAYLYLSVAFIQVRGGQQGRWHHAVVGGCRCRAVEYESSQWQHSGTHVPCEEIIVLHGQVCRPLSP